MLFSQLSTFPDRLLHAWMSSDKPVSQFVYVVFSTFPVRLILHASMSSDKPVSDDTNCKM